MRSQNSVAERPALSVIVPVHNMEKFIGSCLSSILRCQDLSIEVIVVDDGSTDATREVVKSFSDSRLRLVGKQQAGVSAARNTGFEISCGRFVLFFDADDIAVAENWSSILAEFPSHPDAALIYGARRVFKDDAEDFPRTPSLHDPYPENAAVVPLIFKRNFIQPGAAFIRREAIEAVGLWNESLAHGEDWEMWCRLACVGHIIHCPILVFGYRRHGQSATGITVSRDSRDPGLDAIEAIYAHPLVRRRVGVHHHTLKQRALAWRAYYWGTTLIRSGVIWQGIKTLCWSISRDPSSLVLMLSYPKRMLKQRL